MTRENIIKAVLALWLVFFIWSFVFYFITEPDGDGFTRGLNRLSGFLRWHVIAIIMAGIAWTVGGKLNPSSKIRKMRLIPVIIEFACAFLLMATIGYFALIKGEAPAADAMTPKPVPTATPSN